MLEKPLEILLWKSRQDLSEEARGESECVIKTPSIRITSTTGAVELSPYICLSEPWCP